MGKMNTTHNFSYPASAAAVIFGLYLSVRAVFRFDGKSSTIRTACSFLIYDTFK
jgi:hypothetical protein